MDILGIGNAILDIFSFSEEEHALPLGLHPNSSIHVEAGRLDELLLMLKNPVVVSGGSAANALKAASAMGLSCSFIGCTGTEDREEDRWSRLFTAELSSFRVETFLEGRNAPSGRCLVVRMPGGLRSIACAPGAAPTLKPEQIQADILSRASLVLLDGQVLKNAAVTDRVSKLCHGFTIPLAVDIASPEIARNRASAIEELLERNECVLFMDDAEAFAFAREFADRVPGSAALDPERLMHAVFSHLTAHKRTFPYIVRKEGPMGASAWHAGTAVHRAGNAVENPLDDTGAGDVFAGAFLAAFLRKKTLADSLDIANSAARASLSVPGSRVDWEWFASLGEELAPAAAPEETGVGE